MTALFARHKNVNKKVSGIVSQTYSHARSLGLFAAVYKLIIILLQSKKHNQHALKYRPEHKWHSAFAGAIGGYAVWGQHNAVNEQVVLYLMGRVFLSSLKVLKKKKLIKTNFDKSYKVVAALTWGLVMFLFENHEEELPYGLKNSMREIYRSDEDSPL